MCLGTGRGSSLPLGDGFGHGGLDRSRPCLAETSRGSRVTCRPRVSHKKKGRNAAHWCPAVCRLRQSTTQVLVVRIEPSASLRGANAVGPITTVVLVVGRSITTVHFLVAES